MECWARRKREKPAPSTPGRYLSQIVERCSTQSASRPSSNRNLASPRRAVWLFLAHPDSLDAEEEQFLERITKGLPETAKAYRLAQRFSKMVREKDPKISVSGWRML